MIRVLTYFAFAAMLTLTSGTSASRYGAAPAVASSPPSMAMQLAFRDWPVTGQVTKT
jgi:hypothetical protein